MTLLRAVLVLCLFALALPARAEDKKEDMQKYLADTREMVKQEKYAEALTRHIWFFEHALEHEPNMAGARRTSVLNEWKDLGDVYPPAKDAMIEMRDRQTKEVLNGSDKNAAAFRDAAALNRTLDDNLSTIALFQWLDVNEPARAKRYWLFAKNMILEARQYKLAAKYIGNPMREFDQLKHMYDLTSKQGQGGAMLKAIHEERFVEHSLQLIDMSLALDDPKAAKEVQEKARATVDDWRLRRTIVVPEAAQN